MKPQGSFSLGNLHISAHAFERVRERGFSHSSLQRPADGGKPIIRGNTVVTVVPAVTKPSSLPARFVMGLPDAKPGSRQEQRNRDTMRALLVDEGYKKRREEYSANRPSVGLINCWLDGRELFGALDCEAVEGLVVGKGGSTINGMKSEFNVEITIFKNPKENNHSFVYVRAKDDETAPSAEGALKALASLIDTGRKWEKRNAEAFDKKDSPKFETIDEWLGGRELLGALDCEAVEGLVVGKGGSTINGMKSEFNVEITIFKNPKENNHSFVYVRAKDDETAPSAEEALKALSSLIDSVRLRAARNSEAIAKFVGECELLGSLDCEAVKQLVDPEERNTTALSLRVEFNVEIGVFRNPEVKNRSFVYVRAKGDDTVPNAEGALKALSSLIDEVRHDIELPPPVPESGFGGFKPVSPPPVTVNAMWAKVKHDLLDAPRPVGGKHLAKQTGVSNMDSLPTQPLGKELLLLKKKLGSRELSALKTYAKREEIAAAKAVERQEATRVNVLDSTS